MDVNRSVIESVLACFVVASGCQLARFFYQSNQLNYLVFLILRLMIAALVITSAYYLKRGNDTGEVAQIVLAGMIGLWIEN
jgi:hypothetical protein